MLPIILALSGAQLTPDERAFFADAEPAGFILFGRNCIDPAQLRALTHDLRALTGRTDLPILVDQEGGRIARLRPPGWPEQPAAPVLDRLYARAPISAMEAARLHGAALAAMLRESGINVNCAPLLDIAGPHSHPIIAERALGREPMQVASLGRAWLDGMREGGIAGVVKHMPGQGRAAVDSHVGLPVVAASEAELDADTAPFRALAAAAPIAMTAHVIYQAWDADLPATLSPRVIREVIRGRIGFDGLLISDDIVMAALSGPAPERALAALRAGCDLILHCSADIAEMQAIAAALPEVEAEARERLDRALAWASAPDREQDALSLAARRDALLAYT